MMLDIRHVLCYNVLRGEGMNREKVISLVKKSKNKNLLNEVEYFMEEKREYRYDLADALDDAYIFAEENNERGLIKAIRLILIDAGYYIEQSAKPVSCRDFRVTVNKIKYDCVSGWDGWINENSGRT